MNNVELIESSQLRVHWDKNPRRRNETAIVNLARFINDIGFRKDRAIIAYAIEGESYLNIACGSHRFEGSQQISIEFPNLPLKEIWVEVREGTWEDFHEAMLLDNLQHDPESTSEIGYPLRREELQKIRINLLINPKFFIKADQLLEKEGIGARTTIQRIRGEVVTALQEDDPNNILPAIDRGVKDELLSIIKSGRRIAADGREMNVGNIGGKSYSWADVEKALRKTKMNETFGELGIAPRDFRAAVIATHANTEIVDDLSSKACENLIELINQGKEKLQETGLWSQTKVEQHERKKSEHGDLMQRVETSSQKLYAAFDESQLFELVDFDQFIEEYYGDDNNAKEWYFKISEHDFPEKLEFGDSKTANRAIHTFDTIRKGITAKSAKVSKITEKFVLAAEEKKMRIELMNMLTMPPINFCMENGVSINDVRAALCWIFEVKDTDEIEVDHIKNINNVLRDGYIWTVEKLFKNKLSDNRFSSGSLANAAIAEKEKREAEKAAEDAKMTKDQRKKAYLQFNKEFDRYKDIGVNWDWVMAWACKRYGADNPDELTYGKWLDLQNILKGTYKNGPHMRLSEKIVADSPFQKAHSAIRDKEKMIDELVKEAVEAYEIGDFNNSIMNPSYGFEPIGVIERYLCRTLFEERLVLGLVVEDHKIKDVEEILEKHNKVYQEVLNYSNGESGLTLSDEIILLKKAYDLYAPYYHAADRDIPGVFGEHVQTIHNMVEEQLDYFSFSETTRIQRIKLFNMMIDNFNTYLEKAIEKDDEWSAIIRMTRTTLSLSLRNLAEYGITFEKLTEIYRSKGHSIPHITTWLDHTCNWFQKEMAKVNQNPKDPSAWPDYIAMEIPEEYLAETPIPKQWFQVVLELGIEFDPNDEPVGNAKTRYESVKVAMDKIGLKSPTEIHELVRQAMLDIHKGIETLPDKE